MNSKFNQVIVTALSALVVVACGGGSGGETLSSNDDSVTSGTITGFGSVFVNGVEYETGQAQITIDGEAATEDQLAVGMVVTLRGSAEGSTGTATRIEFDDNVEGTVDSGSVDVQAGTFAVLGQQVTVDNMTVFEGTDMASLGAGNVVEVSGWVDAQGSIHATRVELKRASYSAGQALEVEGEVSDLDTAAQTFKLASLTVNYSGTNTLEVPDGTLANDMRVEVKAHQAPSDGVLMADSIEAKDDAMGVEANEDTEIQGLVTARASDSEFTVNNQAVRLGANVEFEHGTAADIQTGQLIEVEGAMNSDGVLVAREVELRAEADIELTAQVEQANQNEGTVTVLGVPVKVTHRTQVRDDSENDVRYFGLGDLRNGDWVEIHAYQETASKSVIATRMERDDDAETELEGPVSNTGSHNLTIMGVNVDTRNARYAIADSTVSAGEFFDQLGTNGIVSAKGHFQGGVLIANEVELED